MYIRPPF